jgi:hypothetical protein
MARDDAAFGVVLCFISCTIVGQARENVKRGFECNGTHEIVECAMEIDSRSEKDRSRRIPQMNGLAKAMASHGRWR